MEKIEWVFCSIVFFGFVLFLWFLGEVLEGVFFVKWSLGIRKVVSFVVLV